MLVPLVSAGVLIALQIAQLECGAVRKRPRARLHGVCGAQQREVAQHPTLCVLDLGLAAPEPDAFGVGPVAVLVRYPIKDTRQRFAATSRATKEDVVHRARHQPSLRTRLRS